MGATLVTITAAGATQMLANCAKAQAHLRALGLGPKDWLDDKGVIHRWKNLK